MPTKSKIQDQTFLFTGTLTEFTRDEAEALVATHGGKVLSGVSGKLNYLVVGEDAGSKLAKAKALGTVKILTEKEFLKMVPKGDAKAVGKTPAKKVPAKAAVKSEVKSTTSNIVSTGASAFEEVKIGNQIWMAKNLDVTHFRNGDPIPEAKSVKDFELASANSSPIQGCYECKQDNAIKYGRLYNWFAINDERGGGARRLERAKH